MSLAHILVHNHYTYKECCHWLHLLQENPEQLFLYHISTKCSMASYANSIHGCKSVLGNDGKTYPIDKQLRQRLTNARYILFCHKKKLVCFSLPLFCSVHVHLSALKKTFPLCTIVLMGLNQLQSCSIFFVQAIYVLSLRRTLDPQLKLSWITSSNAVAFIQAVHVHVVSAPTCLLFQYTWYSVLNCIVCILCCFWNSREAIFQRALCAVLFMLQRHSS